MNKANQARENGLEWEADARYFEARPKQYYRAITILTLLISLLLFFLKEVLLIVLTWLVYFVVYARSMVAPGKTKYQLGRFGVSYYGGLLPYKQIAAFTVLAKKQGFVLRVVTQPAGIQYDFVLPKDQTTNKKIIELLKQKAPFLEELPQTGIEKISRFLNKITGLGN